MRAVYAFAKGSATPTGEKKLLSFTVNPSVSLTANNSPCTGEAMGWSAAYPLHKGAYEDSANSADIASKRSICIVQNISIKSII